MFWLIFLFGFLLSVEALDINVEKVEESFFQHYEEEGLLHWFDSDEGFCKFLRPTIFTLLRAEHQIKPVELITQRCITIPVEILSCYYGKTKLRTATEAEWFEDISFQPMYYARGPDGNYYEMYQKFDNYLLREEVEISPRDIEALFDEHCRKHEKLMWSESRTDTFCSYKFPPDAIAFLSARINTRNVVLVSLKYKKVEVQMLDCQYRMKHESDLNENGRPAPVAINGFEMESHSYAQGPNGKFYEMRPYNIQTLPGIDNYAIFQEVDALPKE